ncbi:helix-turn-helix domain-containing protein [Brevundimonas sp.]|uniref:helix-turn-helix domain-containing protein n=1 Tax=Brevundimonas sp. TaxID=1871086 RepID=UPI0035B179FC
MILHRARRSAPAVAQVVRGYRERTGVSEGPGVIVPLPGRPAQFLEIYLDDPYRVSLDGGDFSPAPEAVVVGPSSRHSARLWVKGPVATFHVAFQPSGFHRLFGVGMDALADRAVAIEDFGASPLRELTDRVRAASDFEARARIADHWIAQRLTQSRPSDGVDRIARLVRRAGGAPPIARMAAHAGLSARQFQRRFTEQVGLTPKLYARTVRFDAVLNARERSPNLTWTDLAHRFGYFDQAHLLRDAHTFTGASPSRLIDPSTAMSDSS